MGTAVSTATIGSTMLPMHSRASLGEATQLSPALQRGVDDEVKLSPGGTTHVYPRTCAGSKEMPYLFNNSRNSSS
jgi:hypothetical protein